MKSIQSQDRDRRVEGSAYEGRRLFRGEKERKEEVLLYT
jgi:hypothetical protein